MSTTLAYLETLTDAAERMAAADRWLEWFSWDAETEWSAEDEQEYNRVLLVSVLAACELDPDEYTPEDIANYREAAA